MNFHVASMGVNFNFGFRAQGVGGEGVLFKLFQKSLKYFPRSLRSLIYIYLGRPLNFIFFILQV